jgi:paraquat-inducible protein B
VEYRGIRVGTVKKIMLGEDPVTEGVVSPVVIIAIEPQRTMGYRDVDDSEATRRVAHEIETSPQQRIESLVKKGLRARLQTGSLVTGQLFVDLDIFPDAGPATVIQGGLYPEIPTVPSSLQGMIANVNRILNKVEQSDLEGTLTNLNALMVSTSSLVSALEREAPGLFKDLDVTLQAANGTLAELQASASADGEIGNQLQAALQEIGAAARSIRVMAEYLQRHPEAMLKGKSGNP